MIEYVIGWIWGEIDSIETCVSPGERERSVIKYIALCGLWSMWFNYESKINRE